MFIVTFFSHTFLEWQGWQEFRDETVVPPPHFTEGNAEAQRREVMNVPKIISQSENELSHLPDLWSDPGPLCPLQVHVQHAAADTALLHPKSQDLYLATGGGRAGPVTSTFLMRRQRLRKINNLPQLI